MEEIKVIKTEYNGILYRSRTEARWAVFMTALNLPFVYEPEGFDLGPAGVYIPDFWLPTLDSFLEIKPETFIHGRSSPVYELCNATRKQVFLFRGMPFPPKEYFPEDEDGSGTSISYVQQSDVAWGPGEDFGYRFCCCPHCKRVGIHFGGRADRIPCKCRKSDHGDKGYNCRDPFLMEAYGASRNAFRFSRKGNS